MTTIIKKIITTLVIVIISFGYVYAQSNHRFDIVNVETLKLKADTIARDYLEAYPDFYGYTVVLQMDTDGQLTNQTFPLDACFRYSLPEELAVDGVGIAVTLDTSLYYDVQIGQITKGKLPLKYNYIGLSEAINLFNKSYKNFVSEVSSVALFHDVSMTEPTYVFRIDNGFIIIGAISGNSGFMKQN